METTYTLWENIRIMLVGACSSEALTLDFVSAFMIMACFLGKNVKLTWKRVLILHGICFAMLLFNAFSLFVRLGYQPEETYEIFTIDLTVLWYVYVFVVALFFFEEKKLLRALEVIAVAFCYNMYVTYVLVNVLGLGYDNPMLVRTHIARGNTYIAFLFFICKVLLSLAAVLIFYFGFYRKELFLRLKLRGMIPLLLWLVLMNFFGGWATGIYRESVQTVTILIVFPVMSIFLPISVLFVHYQSILRERNMYQQTYLDAELAYVEQYKKSQTQTRAFRHDVINQLSLLDILMREGKSEEAKEQLEQMLGEVKNLSPKYVTGDQMLDCIVAMKAAKMEEMGISFTCDGVIDGGLGMKPMESCSIFANALDNAIEAVSKIKDTTTLDGKPAKWIEFLIKRTERFFVIRISNAAEGKVNVQKMFEGGYTSKKDSEYHGFGLQNLRRAVERYDGLVKAEASEGIFRLSVMIPREKN